MNIDKSKKEYIESGYKKINLAARGRQRLNIAFILMANNKKPDISYFEDVFDHIYYRFDCTDFSLITILRMIYLYKDKELISLDILDELDYILTDYDYWISTNTKFPNRKNFWTENHIMLHATDELLAAQLYPDKMFRNRNLLGKDVIPKSEEFILHWIDVKTKLGFCEWDSNTYMDCNVASLVSLIDFAKNKKIVEAAEKLMNLVVMNFALNQFKGSYCGSHGRAYTNEIKNSRHESVRAVMKMLWGDGDYGDLWLHFGALAFATSTYNPPDYIYDIYYNNKIILESFEQQSYNVEDAPLFGLGFETDMDIAFTWPNMGYTHELIINKQIEFGEKYNIEVHDETYKEYKYYKKCKKEGKKAIPCRSTTYMPRVNKAMYKTPDYMLSCAQDYRKGELAFQQHIWQATLAPSAVVFSCQPHEVFPKGVFDHVGVNHTFPKAVSYKNTLISMHKIDCDHSTNYSMLYFPKSEFDETKEVGGWIFGRVANGYIACYSENHYCWSNREGFEHIEAVCYKPFNTYICQMGSKSENRSFDEFIFDVINSSLTFEHETDSIVKYIYKDNTYVIGWDSEFYVNNTIVKTRDYKRVDNIYCQSEYGSGIYEINGEVI